MNTRKVCNSHHVREDVLEAKYLEALRTVMESASGVTEAIRAEAGSMIQANKKEQLKTIEKEIITLQEAVLEVHKSKQRLEISSAEYAAKVKDYSEVIQEKEAQREALQDESIKYAEIRTWLEALDENIRNGKLLTANDSAIMRTIVERIVVRDDGIEVYLRCGVCARQKFTQ